MPQRRRAPPPRRRYLGDETAAICSPRSWSSTCCWSSPRWSPRSSPRTRTSTSPRQPDDGARARVRDRVHDPLQRLPAAAPLPPARAARRPDGARRPLAPGRQPAGRREPRRARGGRAPASRVRPHARATRGRAPACVERRARGPGGGARARRPRPARRGQPVADRAPAAPRGDPREGAARARRRARRDQRTLANQAMQELLTLARQLRPTALDDLGLKAALARPCHRSRPPERDRDQLRGRGRHRLGPAPGRPDRRLPGRPGGALQRGPPLRRRARARAARPRRRRRSSSTSATTARASPSTRPPAASVSPACASVRCS